MTRKMNQICKEIQRGGVRAKVRTPLLIVY